MRTGSSFEFDMSAWKEIKESKMFKLCVCYEPEDNHFVSENYVALFPEICDRITIYSGKNLQHNFLEVFQKVIQIWERKRP